MHYPRSLEWYDLLLGLNNIKQLRAILQYLVPCTRCTKFQDNPKDRKSYGVYDEQLHGSSHHIWTKQLHFCSKRYLNKPWIWYVRKREHWYLQSYHHLRKIWWCCQKLRIQPRIWLPRTVLLSRSESLHYRLHEFISNSWSRSVCRNLLSTRIDQFQPVSSLASTSTKLWCQLQTYFLRKYRSLQQVHWLSCTL